jgi:hypothetical protein
MHFSDRTSQPAFQIRNQMQFQPVKPALAGFSLGGEPAHRLVHARLADGTYRNVGGVNVFHRMASHYPF